MDILQFAFIVLMIFLYTSQNFFCKKFSLEYPGASSDETPVLTIFGGIVVAVVSFFFSGMTFEAQPLTILFGLLNAAVLYGYNYFLLKGSGSGPYSVLMVFAVFGGIAVPSAAKWIGFNEKMTGPAIIFLVLVVISVYLMSLKSENGKSSDKITTGFLMYCFGIFLCNGIYATILSIQQKITGEAEKEELIITTFLAAALFSLITLLVRKTNIKKAFFQTAKSATYLIVYALSAAFAVNSLVIILLLDINTGVLYTIQNAGVMLLSVVLSLICFKEKLSKVNVIGCIFMAIGLVGITMFEKVSFSQLAEMISGLLK